MSGDRETPYVKEGAMSERTAEDRVWIWRDSQYYPQVSFTKPDPAHKAIEYMRVLSRQEAEKLAVGGALLQQYINSLLRTVEEQRRQIASMTRRIEECRSDD